MRPVALYRPTGRWQEVIECDEPLARAGLRPGTPLREAQARWPNALFAPDDADRASQAFAGIVEFLGRFSPAVEAAAPGLAFFDATGLTGLYGDDDALARRAQREVEAESGYPARLSIADDRFTARVAAQRATPHCVVPPGDSATFLAPLPIELLPVPVAVLPRLRALGVRTLGDFARLPANAVAHRLGDAGRQAHRVARGRDATPLRPIVQPLVLSDIYESEWAEESLDRLIFVLKGLADRLARRLAGHNLACRRLRVHWTLESGDERDETLHLAEPSASAGELLDHLRWHVEGLALTSPVTAITLTADDVAPLTGRQLKLPDRVDGGDLGTANRRPNARRAIAHLMARWGDAVVGQAELLPSRRPEGTFQWQKPAIADDVEPGPPPEPLRADLPLWLHAPPLLLTLRQTRAGTIVRYGRQRGRVTASEGPWRLVEGEWNRLLRHEPGDRDAANAADERDHAGATSRRDDTPSRDGRSRDAAVEPAARDYFQVVLAEGPALLVFRERDSDRWFVQGEYG